jgi:FdhD protein
MSSAANSSIHKLVNGVFLRQDDVLAVEEPLEIRLEYSDGNHRVTRPVSVTMRTPGSDEYLALGFLFTEGIIHAKADVLSTTQFDPNAITVHLNAGILPKLAQLERNFYTTSSCGVCGKSSIDAIRQVSTNPPLAPDCTIPAALLHSLPEKLRQGQTIFESTGGLHAAAIFSLQGELLLLQEDVGRHNALDKLMGTALLQNLVPLDQHILLLSGRASFELIQKAAMAGVRIIAAVGAPSSLAVQLASEFEMSLVGFLRSDRLNVYTGKKRLL